jgi:peptidoglycan/LPS O-acetylase OafA/YrhL
MKTRLEGIDVLRGVAALSVTMFHFSWSYGNVRDGTFTPSFSFVLGRYGVDLFFMISGFVIFMTLERSHRLLDFAVSRFARLYPAFWTALLLAIVALSLDGRPTPSFGTIVANVTMVPGFFGEPLIDQPYWTLAYEILFYFLAAGFFFLSGRSDPEIACVGWLLISVLMMGYVPSLMKMMAAPCSYLFVTGIMVYRVLDNRSNYTSYAVLVTAIFISTRIPFSPNEHISGLLCGALTSAFAMVLWLGGQVRVPRHCRLLVYFGEISYVLYLIHDQFGFTMLHAATALGLPPDLSIITVLLLVLGTAGAINAIVERPAQRWIKNYFLHHNRAAQSLVIGRIGRGV